MVAVGFTKRSGGIVGWATWNGFGWLTCDVTNVPAGCNGGSGTPPVPGQTTWIGKGAMAADGLGHVVYVVLGSNVGPTVPNFVVAIVSSDDGQHFTVPAQLVNEPGGDCDPATEDLPDVTFDYTTQPATLWVAWRHKNGSSYGACVRRGQVSPAGIQWLDHVRSVGGMDREDDFNPSMGQGGIRIVAGDGVVSIGYSNNDQLASCPSTALISMAWGTVTSYDNGQNWTPTSVAYHTTTFSLVHSGRSKTDYAPSI
jgi:hypothetical protein